jgi:hypothetical protein
LVNPRLLLLLDLWIWCFCEFLLLWAVVLLSGVRTPLMYILPGCLFMTVFIKIGYGRDFMMRGSIPALFLLMVFVCAALKKTYGSKKRHMFLILMTMLVYGGVTPLSEIYRAVKLSIPNWRNLTFDFRITADFWDKATTPNPNFMGFIEGSSYGKYLMP